MSEGPSIGDARTGLTRANGFMEGTVRSGREQGQQLVEIAQAVADLSSRLNEIQIPDVLGRASMERVVELSRGMSGDADKAHENYVATLPFEPRDDIGIMSNAFEAAQSSRRAIAHGLLLPNRVDELQAAIEAAREAVRALVEPVIGLDEESRNATVAAESALMAGRQREQTL